MTSHPTTSRIGRPAAAAIALLAPALAAGVGLVVGGDLPDPLPTHWNLAGDVDGTTSLTGFTVGVWIALGLASTVALVLVVTARRSPARGAGAAAATWVAWLIATVYVATVVAAAGASVAADVRLPFVIVLPTMLVPLVAAGLAYAVLPRSAWGVPPAQVPVSTIDLADGERVVWVGGASSRRLLVLALVLAVSALPLWFAMWPAALAAVVAAAAVGWAYAVTARVDDDEVTVSWGPALWPRIRVPLGEIAGATAEEIEPLRWGGWGYRRTLKGRAAVVRRGPGLVLTLRNGQRFAVTVDQPEQAADLVNALLVRAER